jgi:hypothetical protein
VAVAAAAAARATSNTLRPCGFTPARPFLLVLAAAPLAGPQTASYAAAVPEPEEVAVPVVLVHEGVTQEQYEESIRKLTGGKERMESPADWPVPGLLAHIPGQSEKCFRVVDVWESQEALDAFAAKLIPILEEIGVQGAPEVYPAHTYVSA